MDRLASALRSRAAIRAALIGFCTAGAIALPASGDEIVVGGKPLSGKVVAIKPEGIEVETTYGKGNVLVPYEGITELRTDAPFVVVHGDDGQTVGRLVGVRDGALLVGDDPASATAVPVATLFKSVTEQEYRDSLRVRMRSAFRNWTANMDFSFAATDATTNSLAIATGFEIERKKSPTRFLATGSFRYGTKDDPSSNPSKSTTENELLGVLRGEYDVTPLIYAYAAGSAEYDAVESLSLRATPKTGAGVHIINTKKYTWDADVGGAWVYERYFGGQTNGYFAVAFGTETSLTLPYGVTFTARGDYLPNVEDWAKDYLLRGTAALLFPMTDWLSFKTGVLEQYDNTPAQGTDRNSVTLTAGLALVF
jgi:hypothetical protein